MATDGVKIIDGDDAHGNYWSMMDMYDANVDLETIKKEYPLKTKRYYDDFENEIYITSVGLAYWELGLMTDEYRTIIKEVIDKNACIDEWKAIGEKYGKARQRVLSNFWKKISKTNKKVRKIKKYRQVKYFHFQENDVVVFRLYENIYGAGICHKIRQYRGVCTYHFVITNYSSKEKPTIKEILNYSLFGTKINAFADFIKNNPQNGVEKIWEFIDEKKDYYLGLKEIGITHKDLTFFKKRFEVIGKVYIKDDLKRTGSFGGAWDFESFVNDVDSVRFSKSSRIYQYPINLMIVDSH